jgi:hypothetical protein
MQGSGKDALARLAPVSARYLTASLAIVAALAAAGCSGSGGSDASTSGETSTVATTVEQDTTGKNSGATASVTRITLHGSASNTGPWATAVSLELPAEKLQPRSFYICAARDQASSSQPCKAAAGAKLPPGTQLRLEQRPSGPAVTNPDSPGWGTVGSSSEAELTAVLSNFVTGDKPGTVTFKVTLRPIEGGAAIETSNTITVTWTK